LSGLNLPQLRGGNQPVEVYIAIDKEDRIVWAVVATSEAAGMAGGEAFNIVDGKTGLRVESMDVDKLKNIILDISSNKQKYIEMGNNAYEHYWLCRKPEDMAQGVIDAIEYVMNK